MNINKIRKITIILSLIIHLLFFVSYKPLSSIQLFRNNDLEEKIEDQEKQIIFELVETPDDAESEQPPDDTNLLSDKNSIARDRYVNKDKETGAPYSKGDLDVKNIIPNTDMDRDDQYVLNENKDTYDNILQDDDYTTESSNQTKFSRQVLLGKNNQTKNQQRLERPQYDSEDFNAREIGGLTFNTYEWDFAPYMLEMKRKVERHVFPPPAFTHMGLISGETILRFKVMPNGELKDLKVLNYKGHKSLMETSVQAIKNSAPFKPLPSDFPENYLEVTASFSYYIRRN